MTVDGTAEESLSGIASVTCAGEEASLSGSNFSCDLTLDAGANSIAVEATDVAGNTASETLTVTYATGPQVTITSPPDFSLVTAGPIVVSGTIDEEDATVTVAGVPAGVSGGSFNASVPLHSGANTITVVATSQNGSSAIATVHVTLDDSPPLVTIDSPLDGQTVNTSMITVSGMVKDIIGPAVDPGTTIVSVNGVAATITNDRYSASNVALAAGLNTITAFATDSVGNSNSASISVSFVDVTGQPRIEVVSGDGQQGTAGTELSSPLIARVVDAGGNGVAGVPVVFQITRNNGTLSDGSNSLRMLTATTGATGEAQVNWTLGTRAGEGANLVEATAAGFEGVARYTATGTPGAELHLHADAGENQNGIAGQPLPQPFAVVVTDAGHNRLGNIPVTYTVIEGAGGFGGQASLVVNTDPGGRAFATLTLGPAAGITNNVVQVDVAGNTGAPARFSASAEASGDPAQTRVSGVVLDNTDIPIEGVTVSLEGTGIPPVQTNVEGQFVIQPAPLGNVMLHVDGSTALRPGAWASLEFELVTIPGRDNTTGRPIYLLPLDVPNGLQVSETVGGTITLAEIPGFALTVEPGSATFPGGGQSGVVSVTAVHADKVPMVPNFGQQPRLVVTIQPPGVIFDPPAQVTYPNLDGLAPGEITEFYSFDHDMGTFVAIGTGSVSEDGTVIQSDPGIGIPKGGWQCAGNPQPTGQCQPAFVSIIDSRPIVTEPGEVRTVTAVGGPGQSTFNWTSGNQSIVQLLSNAGPTITVQGNTPGSTTLLAQFRPQQQGVQPADDQAEAKNIELRIDQVNAQLRNRPSVIRGQKGWHRRNYCDRCGRR